MRNLEAKFRLSDLNAAREVALALGYAPSTDFFQRDTFYDVAHGKLKLREQGLEAWLIHYARDHQRDLMLSRYDITPVIDAKSTREMLARAVGVIAEVRKHRALMVRRNVRFHLDRVENLGDFGEIEAVLGPENPSESGQALVAARADVEELLGALGIGPHDLLELSYYELIPRARG